MKRPYKEFVERWLGKRVDYDKAYGYQCVDLIKQYADECLGMGRIGVIGNAKTVPKGSFGSKFSQLYVSKGDIMQGDIIIRTIGEYGHIAIVDHVLNNKIYVLEQNGSGKNSGNGIGQNAIRIKDYKKDWYQVILRNESIVKNFNQEMAYVDDKIQEREKILKDTKDYKSTIRFLSTK